MNCVFRFAKCCFCVCEHLIAKVTYAKPAAWIFWITAKLVKSESPVRAAENINANAFTI
jgi:hypothetical protein